MFYRVDCYFDFIVVNPNEAASHKKSIKYQKST